MSVLCALVRGWDMDILLEQPSARSCPSRVLLRMASTDVVVYTIYEFRSQHFLVSAIYVLVGSFAVANERRPFGSFPEDTTSAKPSNTAAKSKLRIDRWKRSWRIEMLSVCSSAISGLSVIRLCKCNGHCCLSIPGSLPVKIPSNPVMKVWQLVEVYFRDSFHVGAIWCETFYTATLQFIVFTIHLCVRAVPSGPVRTVDSPRTSAQSNGITSITGTNW